tara:strand:- start:10103 stop:19714 length:9612 start_codon:yes stop_codon:yes gene_type:complete
LKTRWAERFESAPNDAERAGWATLSGLLAEDAGDSVAAERWFTLALGAAPDQTRTRIALGGLLANSGEFDEAIAILEAGYDPEATDDPQQIELLRQLALTQERDFQTESANQTWELISAHPLADSFLLEEAAEAFARNQDYETAQSIYAKLTELSKDDPYQVVRIQIRIARLKENNGDFDEALTIYRTALSQTSGTSWLQKELRTRVEQVYRKQEDLPGLAEHYEGYLEERGSDTETALLLAKVMDELGRTSEGTDWIRKAASWSPNQINLKILLAERLVQSDQPASAVEVLRPLATANPDNALIAEKLGDAYWNLYTDTDSKEDRALALQYWNATAPESSASASAVLHLAEILRSHYLESESLEAYARASALDPDSIDIREQWADWLFFLDQPEEGQIVLDGIVAEPEQQTADRFLRLAQLRKRYENLEGSLLAVEEGLELEPTSFDLLSLKWEVLAQEERWEEAVDLYPALSENAPNQFFRKTIDQRHLRALTAAEQIEDTLNELSESLGSETLSENDIGLLLLIASSLRDAEIAQQSITEINVRFPDSVPLNEIIFSYYSEAAQYDEAIAALRTLQSADPKRADEWLQQIASIQLEAEQFEAAIATAEERVALNPSKVEAQLFLANIYQGEGQVEQAIETLRTGIRLADDSAPIRLQLIEYLSAYGYSQEAYNEAQKLFQEAETVEERLQSLPKLTNLALQVGQFNDLIRGFEQKRMSEEDGYRYALFLASIYETVGDYTAARDNLIEALVSRPNDTVILSQIINLARTENDNEEVAQFTKQLANLDPSDENIFAHLNALLAARKNEDAFTWIKIHQDIFLKNLGSLQSVVEANPENASEIIQVFGRSLRQLDDDVQAQLVLGEMLLSAQDEEGAAAIFWNILEKDPPQLPIASPPTGANSVQNTMQGSRLNLSHQARQKAMRTILAPNQNRHSHYRTSSGGPTFQQVQDSAMIYLAALAIKDETPGEFLARLEPILETRADPQYEKMVAYAILHEFDLAEAAALEILARNTDDPIVLDEIQYVIYQTARAQSASGDTEAINRAIATISKINERRTDKDPDREARLQSFQLNMVMEAGRKEEAVELANKILDGYSPEKIQDLHYGFRLAFITGNYEVTQEWLEIALSDPKLQATLTSNPYIVMGLIYSPISSLRNSNAYTKISEEEAVRISLANLRRYWARSGSAPASAQNRQVHYSRGGHVQGFPGQNRWISSYEVHMIRQVAQNLSPSPEAMKEFTQGISAAAEELEGERQIEAYLTLALIYHNSNAKEKAAEIASKLVASYPEDSELQTIAAISLLESEQYEDVLELLSTIRPTTLPEEKNLWMIEIKALSALKRDDDAKNLAREFLKKNRINTSDYAIRNTLNQAGINLNDVSPPRPKRPSNVAASLRSGDWQQINLVLQQMREYKNQGKTEEAQGIAERILSRDPGGVQQNNLQHIRDSALDIYINDDEATETAIGILNTQLEAAPDSAFLHFRIAELSIKRKSRKKSFTPYEPHVEAVIALRPNDSELLSLLANKLMQAQDYDQATEIYSIILKNDPSRVARNSHDLVRAFIKSDQIDSLGELIEDPVFIRKLTSGGNSWALSNLIQQIAQNLENEKKIEEALYYRKQGLPHMPWDQRFNQIGPIIDLSILLDQVEEAQALLWEELFEESTESEAEAHSFGFNTQRTLQQQNWFNSANYRGSTFSVRGVEILDRIDQLELNEKVLNWLANDRPVSLKDQDAALIEILIRLNQNDATVVEFINDPETKTALSNLQNNHHSPLVNFTIAERLETLEGVRAEAFQFYDTQVVSPQFNNPNLAQNSHHLIILVRGAVAMSSLAESEAEKQRAVEIMEKSLILAQGTFKTNRNNTLARNTTVELLLTADQLALLDDAEWQEWLEQIRSTQNWGSHAQTTADFLETIIDFERPKRIYPGRIFSGKPLPMLALPENEKSRRANLLLGFAPSTDGQEPPLQISLTPGPSVAPVQISSELFTPEFAKEVLSDGFGYVRFSREGSSKSETTASDWKPVSLAPNLLPHPNPASAPSAGGPRSKEGWESLPTNNLDLVHFPSSEPIQSGTHVKPSQSNRNSEFYSTPIPIEGQPDLLLSGWFTGTDQWQDSGYFSIGLVFLNKNKGKIRTYNFSGDIPFEEIWSNPAILYTTKGSARKGRYIYPDDAHFVQLEIRAEAGMTFGGISLHKLPVSIELERIDAREIVYSARKAIEKDDADTAGSLFLEALQTDPQRAIQYWNSNSDEWTSGISRSSSFPDILAFLALPEVHREDSFRYRNRHIRNSSELLSVAETALQYPNLIPSQELIATLLSEKTCLSNFQVELLYLQARAAGFIQGAPEKDKNTALSVLGIPETDSSSPYKPSATQWETAMLCIDQLDLLPTVLVSIENPNSFSNGSVMSLMALAWIQAESSPNKALETLEIISQLSKLSGNEKKITLLIIARMAATSSGIEDAKEGLTLLSKISGQSLHEVAKYRFNALQGIVDSQEAPTPALLEAVKEAKMEWILSDPSRNTSTFREILAKTIDQQDFATALQLMDAIENIPSFGSSGILYQHLFPRVAEPDTADAWAIPLPGPVAEDGTREILVRFHPDNNFPPQFYLAGSAHTLSEPVYDSIAGLEEVAIRFGEFPNDMKTLATTTPSSGYPMTAKVEMPSNGFLRAVALINGEEIAGPVIPVFSGIQVPFEVEGQVWTDSSLLPPAAHDFTPISKSRRIHPDISEVDPLQYDFILSGWADSSKSSPYIRLYPRYSHYDRVASTSFKIRPGEYSLITAFIPGEAGPNGLGPLKSIDLRIPRDVSIADFGLLAVDRSQSAYLQWLREVRNLHAEINQGLEVNTEKLVETAFVEPYGAAAYLLPPVIKALVEAESDALAIEYLQAIDPRDASPFQQNVFYYSSLRRALQEIIESPEIPDDIRWEAALTRLRIPEQNTRNRIAPLYTAAGENPIRLQVARDSLKNWLMGTGSPSYLADQHFREAAENFHTSSWSAQNPLTDILLHDYDAEIDALVRQRFEDIDFDLSENPGQELSLVTLLIDPTNPADLETLQTLVNDTLEMNTSWYKRSLFICVGARNLTSQGAPPEVVEPMLLQTLEAFLEEDPLSNQYDPPRAPILIAASLLNINSSPPLPVMTNTAQWIIDSCENSRTRDNVLVSEPSFQLIDFLGESGQIELRNELINAIREKASDSRRKKRLEERYPQSEVPLSTEEE